MEEAGDSAVITGNGNSEFHDPLGVKPSPIVSSPSVTSDDVECEINPIKSVELDRILAEARNYDLKTKLEHVKLNSDEEEEENDLFVTVDNPEKHASTMETYITFRVNTKTTRDEFEQTELFVRRRYSDFLWLRNMLEKTQPTHLIPPLPEKHSLKRFDHFSPEFVRTRQRMLQKFLQRIANHPVLSFNKHFTLFLTAKKSEFQACRKEGGGTMSRWAESFHNASSAYMIKTRSQEFVDISHYIQTFGEKMATIERISQRVVKEQYELTQELNQLGPHFTLWSNSEDKLYAPLSAIAKAIERCYVALTEVHDSTETEMNQHIKEYMLYTDAIKAVLRRRDAIQMEYEMTLDELQKKKDERDMVAAQESEPQEKTYSFGIKLSMGRNADDVIRDLNRRSRELQQNVEQLNDRTVCADTDLKADMERWHKDKRKDFKRLFVEMCDRQINYYSQSLQAWEDVLPLLRKTENSAKSQTQNLTQDIGNQV